MTQHLEDVGTSSSPLDRLTRNYGSDGWLSFFILSLVFIAPATRLLSFLGSYSHSMEIFARSGHPYSFYGFYFVEQLANFAVQGYGVFAGIRLWRIRPGAVRQAKRFLLMISLFAFVDYMSGAILTILATPEANRALALSRFLHGRAAMALIETTIYAALWYGYLVKSKRVRLTFSQDLPAANIA